jgi:hypothetical protein
MFEFLRDCLTRKLRPTGKKNRRRARPRLQVEPLETRQLLSSVLNVALGAADTYVTLQLDPNNANYYQILSAGNVVSESYIPNYDTIDVTMSAVGIINVVQTPANVVVNLAATGQSYVNVGNGSVQGIQGTLQITNPPSFNAITVNDSADPVAANATLNQFTGSDGNQWGSILGLAPAAINYRDIDTSSLQVVTGTSSANRVTVLQAPAPRTCMSMTAATPWAARRPSPTAPSPAWPRRPLTGRQRPAPPAASSTSTCWAAAAITRSPWPTRATSTSAAICRAAPVTTRSTCRRPRAGCPCTTPAAATRFTWAAPRRPSAPGPCRT